MMDQTKKQQISLESKLEIRLVDYLSDKEKYSRREPVLRGNVLTLFKLINNEKLIFN